VNKADQRTHSWTPKIQRGGQAPSWKSLNRKSHTKSHQILMKFGFGTQQQIWNSVTDTWPNIFFFKFKMPDGRHIQKSFFWPQVISRLSDFSEILHEETVILRISAMGQSIRVLQNVFFVFLMQFGVWWAGASRIVSDTLVCQKSDKKQ